MSKSCLCYACAVPLPCLCRAFCRSCRAVVVHVALTRYAFAAPATLSLTLSIYFDVSESYDGILFSLSPVKCCNSCKSVATPLLLQVICQRSPVAAVRRQRIAVCIIAWCSRRRDMNFAFRPSQVNQFLIFLLLAASSVAAGSHS